MIVVRTFNECETQMYQCTIVRHVTHVHRDDDTTQHATIDDAIAHVERTHDDVRDCNHVFLRDDKNDATIIVYRDVGDASDDITIVIRSIT